MKCKILLQSFIYFSLLLAISSLVSCGDDNDDPIVNKKDDVSNSYDPEGTITTTLVKNANGISLLPNEHLHGSSIRLDDNLNIRIYEYNNGKFGNHIENVGAVNSLSDIKTLPTLGQTVTTIPKVGDGYIITFVGDEGNYSGLINQTENITYFPKVRYVKMRISQIVKGLDGNVSGIEIKYCEWLQALDRKIEPNNNILNKWLYHELYGCRGYITFKNPVRYEVKSQPDFVKEVKIYNTHAVVYLKGLPGGWEGNLILTNSSGDVSIKLDALSTDYN